MLEVRGLWKNYGSVTAVRDLSFALEPGEVLGLLGPNGSGKSTTVNILTGLLEPSEGKIYLDGRAAENDLLSYKSQLGYVPEVPHLYTYLTGREYLELVGALRSMPLALVRRRSGALLELLGLSADGHARISSYSKGMRQKILIAAAVMHDPRILIFDEPLSGLDVTSALVFRHLVSALAKEAKIIVYSSHMLESVEKICSKVIILDKGSVVARETVGKLRELAKQGTLEDVFRQLVVQVDTEAIASGVVQAMKIGF